jgi:hypothetical protein
MPQFLVLSKYWIDFVPKESRIYIDVDTISVVDVLQNPQYLQNAHQ